MSHQQPLAEFDFAPWITPKGFARLHRSGSSASPRDSFVNGKLYVRLPKGKLDRPPSEPLFQQCYLSSEEELSPVDVSGHSFCLPESDVSDDDEVPVPSLPEELANMCPGKESEVATVVSFASAGRAKMVSVKVSAASRTSTSSTASTAADSQLSRPCSSSNVTRTTEGIAVASSRPSRSSSINSTACLSESSSTQPCSSSTSIRSQQTPLSSSPTTPSPSFLDYDPFANATVCPPFATKSRGHSRLRSFSNSMSQSVLNLQLDLNDRQPKQIPSQKEKRKSMQMAARGATERSPAVEIPPCPVVSYEGPHWRGKEGFTTKKIRNRKSIFASLFT